MNELDTNKHEIKALWKCIRIVLDNGIASPADAGLLMEAMSRVAEQYKETTKGYTLKLEDKFLKPCWHCCNIVLQNDLVKEQTELTVIILLLEKLAEEIDYNTMMDKPALELVK